MEIIDVLGKPCPIPVIEARKALMKPGADSVLVKVDNIVAVQNLEKMAKGSGYGFSYEEKSANLYEVSISLDGKSPPVQSSAAAQAIQCIPDPAAQQLVVLIGRNMMGEGAEELGKILIKGFIYSLTELAVPPAAVIFLNSGAYLTSEGSNTIEDLKKLEEKGTAILTCGTCVNFYGLQDKLSVGTVTNMFGITERMASASNVINI
jgi:selenium metabolism protein YedF